MPKPDCDGRLRVAVVRRLELEADQPFRFQLFCDSRPPGEELNALNAPLREQLLQLQFAGQSATYRGRYPHALCEIIEAEGASIGRIVTAWSPDACVLIDIAILPSWRSRGIGATIVREICAEAGNAGAVVRASVSLSNIAASRFWSRLGFETVELSAVSGTLERRPPPERPRGFDEPI